jgi:hypothetical protein
MTANNFASLDILMDSFNKPSDASYDHVYVGDNTKASITGLLDNVEYVSSVVPNHKPEEEAFNFDVNIMPVTSYLTEFDTMNDNQEGEKCNWDSNIMYAKSPYLTESVSHNEPKTEIGNFAKDAKMFELLFEFSENIGFK